MSNLQPMEWITNKIMVIHGQRVMIDADLAELYGVTTKRLNEQVRRNQARFPEDFVFQLSEAEKRELVANCDHLKKLKFSKSLPYAFTEHGAIQAANVLNSQQAVEVGVYVVRAFVRLRELLVSNRELEQRLNALEQRIEHKLELYDENIAGLIDAIRQLMAPPATTKRPIGFVYPKDESGSDSKSDSASSCTSIRAGHKL